MLVARKQVNREYLPRQGLPGKYIPARNLTPPVAQGYKQTAAASRRAQGNCTLREGLLLYFLLFLLIVVGIGVISQYGRIAACNYRIQHLQKEIALLQEEREGLCIEVKRLGALERIEKIAKSELGLQHPEKRQWLVLSARGKNKR